jgi:glycosyltransferase involved in cell wall biosynthesis
LTDLDKQSFAALEFLRDALGHPLLVGRFKRPVNWFYSPMTAPYVLGQIPGEVVVYDCMDELANFRFAPADMRERERFLLSAANVVFTGGYQLFEAKRQSHNNVSFFGCGVDSVHFGKARQAETEVPAELRALSRPVLGYFGVIDERLDYQLLAALADQMPESNIVMAGPVVKVDAGELPQRKNIHWLGQRPYSELPGLVKGFNVCLMPFALNEATRYINPTKTLEYMAAGKPIVSTAVPDVVRNFASIVRVAKDTGGFISATREACEAPRVDLIAMGIEKARASSWDSIVAEMERKVTACTGLQKFRTTSWNQALPSRTEGAHGLV